jgi:hypothetical protein
MRSGMKERYNFIKDLNTSLLKRSKLNFTKLYRGLLKNVFGVKLKRSLFLNSNKITKRILDSSKSALSCK